MSSELFQLAAEIFLKVRVAPLSARTAILETETAGNALVREEVERLLSGDAMPTPFRGLAEDIGEIHRSLEGSETLADAWSAPPGIPIESSGIGPYRLIRLIGEGGLGLVYLAEQDSPIRRRVALKIIRRGMESRQLIARFEVERQAIALMDHPNVARVFDAGATEAGLPWFVMEFIDGPPITRYCDTRQLSVNQRLELFVQVCHAIQHAHEKGIIHRDIKPTNVLVATIDSQPVPKVIDFGIAKMAESTGMEQVTLTCVQQLIGTPLYMSPEQTRGEVADTRSDVYSLGVVLYELLTGTTPTVALTNGAATDAYGRPWAGDPVRPSTRVANLAGSMESMKVTDPGGKTSNRGQTAASNRSTRVSNLVRLLRRDLDWIAMKAIERERSHRYETVAALAEDVERYLAGIAVRAGPRSPVYRFRKTVARHRVAIVVALTIVCSLIFALALSIIELRTTRAARRVAMDELYRTRLAQARAGRYSGKPGQRIEGLRALAEAAAQRSSIAGRNEAIGCLALPDIELIRHWESPTDDLCSITFDTPAERFARSDGRGNISIYDARNDHLIRKITGDGVPIGRTFCFSPDGVCLLATYAEGPCRLRIWRIQTGDLVFRQSSLELQKLIEFSPDGRTLALCLNDREIRFLDTSTWSPLRSLSVSPPPHRLHFNPMGRQIAVCSPERGIRVIDLSTGAVLRQIGQGEPVADFAWSADGTLIAAAGEDKRITVWRTATGTLQAVLEGHLSHPVMVCFDHGGNVLASTATDNTLRLWDPFSGRQTLEAEDLPYIQFSPDDTRIVTTGGGFAHSWNFVLNRVCRNLGGAAADGEHPSVDISNDSSQVASSSAFGVRLWELKTGHPAGWAELAGVRSVHFAADGRSLLAYSESGPRQWPMPLPLPAGSEPRGQMVNWTERGPAAWSADGRMVVFCRSDGRVFASDTTSPAPPVLLGRHLDQVHYVAVSPDGHWAATSRRADAGFKVWNLVQHRLETELPSACRVLERGGVTFSPDGRWLVTSDPDAYRFWAVGSWKPGQSHLRAVPFPLSFAAFTSDQKTMAVVSSGREIRLLEPQSGTELAVLRNPQPHEIECFCFSRDGRYLVVGNNDSTVTAWDITLLRSELRKLKLDWTSAN